VDSDDIRPELVSNIVDIAPICWDSVLPLQHRREFIGILIGDELGTPSASSISRTAWVLRPLSRLFSVLLLRTACE
jgi:hypothetical protein